MYRIFLNTTPANHRPNMRIVFRVLSLQKMNDLKSPRSRFFIQQLAQTNNNVTPKYHIPSPLG